MNFFFLNLKKIVLGFTCGFFFLSLSLFAAPLTGPAKEILSSSTATVKSVSPLARAGFDIDDTLLFSTPAFRQGFQSEAEPYSAEFWKVVNSSDPGHSRIKKRVFQVVQEYRKQGVELYAVTSRKKFGAGPLLDYLGKELGIPKKNVFFMKDKTKKIVELGLDVYYGDSDSDIEASRRAGIRAVRVLRSPESSYQENYHPGKYGEEILPDSEE